jgi:hypothetical protein
MKKVILILVGVAIYAIGCTTRTTQPETPIQDSVEAEIMWTDMPICQSCCMPMTEELFGTNADGSANHEYCKYCYMDGKFTAPDMTMDEMISLCVPHMVEQGMTEEVAHNLLKETLPLLKRWQVQEQE